MGTSVWASGVVGIFPYKRHSTTSENTPTENNENDVSYRYAIK